MSDETKFKGMGAFRDTIPVDWDQKDEFHGFARLYRDLIRLRLNRDDFQGYPSSDVVAEPGEYDGFPFHAALSMGAYSVLIFSQ